MMRRPTWIGSVAALLLFLDSSRAIVGVNIDPLYSVPPIEAITYAAYFELLSDFQPGTSQRESCMVVPITGNSTHFITIPWDAGCKSLSSIMSTSFGSASIYFESFIHEYPPEGSEVILAEWNVDIWNQITPPAGSATAGTGTPVPNREFYNVGCAFRCDNEACGDSGGGGSDLKKRKTRDVEQDRQKRFPGGSAPCPKRKTRDAEHVRQERQEPGNFPCNQDNVTIDEELDHIYFVMGREQSEHGDHWVPYVKLTLHDSVTAADIEIQVMGDPYATVYYDGDVLLPEFIDEYVNADSLLVESEDCRNKNRVKRAECGGKRRRRQGSGTLDFESFTTSDPKTLVFNDKLWFIEPGHAMGYQGVIMYEEPLGGALENLYTFRALHMISGIGFALSEWSMEGQYSMPLSGLANVGLCSLMVIEAHIDHYGEVMDADVNLGTGWTTGGVAPTPTGPAPTVNATCDATETIGDHWKKKCEDTHSNVEKQCGQYADANGVFSKCFEMSNNADSAIDSERFFEECKRAACLKNKAAVCEIVEHFAELCQTEYNNNSTGTLELKWREVTGCYIDRKSLNDATIECIDPREQKLCTRPAGCTGFTEDDKGGKCVELVQCHDGMFYNGKKCVEKC